MAPTKKEVESFLNSLEGKMVNIKCGVYNGQCVSLIKALLEFLGAPEPYKARGNATDVDNTLLRENIAENGKGWLTVVVNHDMGYIGGVHYGHIWLDLKDTANYEQNGHQALHTTKDTRPISQGQQFVNLDKWIKKEGVIEMVTKHQLDILYIFYLGKMPDALGYSTYVGKKTFDEAVAQIRAHRSYKALQADAAAGKLDPVKHLPDTLRLVYKPPVLEVKRTDVVDYINKNLK